MSAFCTITIIIHEGSAIVGNFEYLLSCGWVIDQQYDIPGTPGGYEILLPRSKQINIGVNTSSSVNMKTSLLPTQFDAPGILDDLGDFNESVDELANIVAYKTIALGPLSACDLQLIQPRIHDPPLKIISDDSE